MLVRGAAYSAAGTVVRASSAPAAGCCLKVMLEGAAVRVARALWCEHAGAAAGCPARCCLRVLLSQCARFGGESGVYALELACWCRCRVLLQGAAAGCCCRVPLQGAAAGCCAVRVACALWRWLGGAAAGCCCWSGVCTMELACQCRFTVPLQGGGAGYNCQRPVCILGN